MAFQKLYRTAARQDQKSNDRGRSAQADRIADVYCEDKEESVSLDRIFNDVLTGKPALQARAIMQRTPPRNTIIKPDYAASGEKLAAEKKLAAEAEQKAKALSEAASRAAALKIKERRASEMERFKVLLQNAHTDLEIWHILEREVFARIRILDLDQPPSKNRSQAREEARAKASIMTEQSVLFHNFPQYLVQTIQTLRSNFPASPLPLSILPALKSLGRSSYALGATTSLYYHLIHTAWVQLSSYPTINILLENMENDAIEFNTEILGLLKNIIKQHNMAISGGLGREMLMVCGSDLFREGAAKIEHWKDVIEQRLGPMPQNTSQFPRPALRTRIREMHRIEAAEKRIARQEARLSRDRLDDAFSHLNK